MHYQVNSCATTSCTGHIPFQASIRFTCLPETVDLTKATVFIKEAEDQLHDALVHGAYELDGFEIQETDGNEVFFKGNIVVPGYKAAILKSYAGAKHETKFGNDDSIIDFPRESVEKMKQLGMEPHIYECGLVMEV